MKSILINAENLETRIAVVEDGKLSDYKVERAGGAAAVAGSIYKGRIQNLEPSLQAAFVNVGLPKNVFLHYWDMFPATAQSEEIEAEDAEDAAEEVAESENAAAEEAEATGFFKRLQRIVGHANKQASNAEIPVQQGRENKRGNGKKKPSSDDNEAYTLEDIPNLFPVNSEVVVQVTKGPIGGKGARVTTHLSLPGRYLVLMPNSPQRGVSKRIKDRGERRRLRQIVKRLNLPSGMGVICRTAGTGKAEKYFREDLESLLETWRGVQENINNSKGPCCVYEEQSLTERLLRDLLTEDVNEIYVDSRELQERIQNLVSRYSRSERMKVRLHKGPSPIFYRHNLTEQIENIFLREVKLPSGGHICVDETEALIAIDVNTGRSRGGKDHPETILHTNLEAVEEIARQLRLRDIGGLVVLDLIDMRSKQDRQKVYRAFREALKKDRAHTKVLPISELGLVEMTRQRQRESLRERLYRQCPHCSGRGLVKSATSVSVELQRQLREYLQRRKHTAKLRIQVHPDVLQRLKEQDATLIQTLEEEYGGELSFRADEEMHHEEFKIFELDKDEEEMVQVWPQPRKGAKGRRQG